MTEIKGEIDNVTVGMLNGEENFGNEGGQEGGEMGDFEEDFGEFNPDEEMGGEEPAAEEGGESLDDLTSSLDSLSREAK